MGLALKINGAQWLPKETVRWRLSVMEGLDLFYSKSHFPSVFLTLLIDCPWSFYEGALRYEGALWTHLSSSSWWDIFSVFSTKPFLATFQDLF